jgi:pyruvate/2-oxoglutarate/acetoin dehydrogenase E1 component
VASLDVPIPFSPPLERAAVADEGRIERAIRELLSN